MQCFIVLVGLNGFADALHPKPFQTGASDESPAFDKVLKVPPRPDEYHRAANVDRGECTKRLNPTLLFIGEAYSGSTSLSDQMQLHPELSHGDTKEHQYFKPDPSKISSNEKYKQYQEEFWVSCNATVAYDATMYLGIAQGTKTTTGEKAVEYVKKRMGKDTKIIVMFRDPVDMLFHTQCKSTKRSMSSRPFSLESPPNCTHKVDNPYKMLSTWLKVFPTKSKWLFLSSDEYFANPQKVLNNVFKFIGVKPMRLENTDLQAQSGRRRCTLKATSQERKAYWSVPDNLENKKQLEKATGLHFSWHTKS